VPARFLTLAITGFWIVMTVLLLQSIWFPADSRLTRVEPGAVFQLIAARGEPSLLDIYDDRKIVGKINVQATRLRQNQRHNIKLRINGNLQLNHPLMAGLNLDLTSSADLSHHGEVQAFDVSITTGKNALGINLKQTGPDQPPTIVLEQNKMILFDSRTLGAEGLESHPIVAILLGSFGISPKDVAAARGQAEKQAAAMVLEARQGTFDLAGTPRQGFVLTLAEPGRPGFRLCVENTGEIVRLETPTSFHFLTETLRALPSPDDDPNP
jgi:hypothetical protein